MLAVEHSQIDPVSRCVLYTSTSPNGPWKLSLAPVVSTHSENLYSLYLASLRDLNPVVNSAVPFDPNARMLLLGLNYHFPITTPALKHNYPG